MKTKLKIREIYPDLSKSESKIADYILKDSNDSIVFMTLSETSKLLRIGEATIIRFCRRVGFDGFQDLKLMLALEKEQQENVNRSSKELVLKSKMIKVIEDSVELVNPTVIQMVINMLHDANYVYIIGTGISGSIAEIFENRLLRIGVRCRSIKEGHLQITQAAIAHRDDLFIAISLTGITEDIYLSVKEAKKNNANIVAVTNHNESPIAELSDCVLLTSGFESPLTGGDTLSMISQFYILSLLCDSYTQKYPNESYDYKTSIAKAIRNKIIKP